MGAPQLFLTLCLLRAMQDAASSLKSSPEIQPCPAEARPLGAMEPARGTAWWQWLCRVTGSLPGCLLGEGDILPWAMRTKGNN